MFKHVCRRKRPLTPLKGAIFPMQSHFSWQVSVNIWVLKRERAREGKRERDMPCTHFLYQRGYYDKISPCSTFCSFHHSVARAKSWHKVLWRLVYSDGNSFQLLLSGEESLKDLIRKPRKACLRQIQNYFFSHTKWSNFRRKWVLSDSRNGSAKTLNSDTADDTAIVLGHR